MSESKNSLGSSLTENISRRQAQIRHNKLCPPSASTTAAFKLKMGLDDFLKKWDSESWKDLEKLEAKRSAPSTSSASTKAKVQKTAGVPAPVTPPEALEAWRRQREEGALPAKETETSVKQATAKEDPEKEEEVKVEVKSEEPDSSSSGFDESEESEDAAPHAKPKVSKREMEFGFFGYKRRGGGRKKRQAKQNKEQRLARLARQGKASR